MFYSSEEVMLHCFLLSKEDRLIEFGTDLRRSLVQPAVQRRVKTEFR